MKRCRSSENADDGVPKLGGAEETPENDAGENIAGREGEYLECRSDHSVGDEENDGDDYYDSDDEEETVANQGMECDEEDGEEDESEAWRPTVSVEQVRRGIANLICFQEVPPHVVKEEAFHQMMTNVCPSLTMTDLVSTKSDCLQLYKEEKMKIKHVLNTMRGSIALSIDLFTYYKGRYGFISHDFLCVAAHFIDDDWKLKKWVLSFQRHNTSKSDFIDDAILKVVKDWNIEDKVANFTSRTDYCNTWLTDEVVDTIKAQVQERRTLPLDSCLFSVRCVAEMFGLMANDAFDEIGMIIHTLKGLSWSRSESMWHITNSKLKHALDLQSLGQFDSEKEVPSADEWDKVKIVHRLVESTHNVAKLVFETKYPTPNKFLYNLHELRAVLVQEAKGSDSFASNVAKKLLQRLENYLKDMFLLMAIASVMDPRFKMQYIEYMASKFEDANGIFKSGPVLEAIRNLYADYIEREKRDNLERASSSKSEDNLENEEVNPQNETWFKEYTKFVQNNNQTEKSDLDLYLEEPVCSWSDDFNTLQWWKSEGPKYPIVAKMARDILAIPLSVATSYEAYYYLENRPPNLEVISSGPELANALMCCWSWSPRSVPDLDIWFHACGILIF